MSTSEKRRSGFCSQCVSKCGVISITKNDQLIKVIPDKNHPNGGICPKGAAAPQIVNHPDRILFPLKRTNLKGQDPVWERITWQEAFRTITDRLKQIRSETGAETVSYTYPTVGASGSFNWGPYLQRLMNLYGTPNYISHTNVCQWARDEGSKYTYGVGLPQPDFEHANLILIWGHNPADTNLQTWKRLMAARKRGSKLVVIDPRRTTTAAAADLWIAPNHGTDIALILGCIQFLIKNQSYDDQFLLNWTNAPFLVDKHTGKFLRPENHQSNEFLTLHHKQKPFKINTLEDPEIWSEQIVLTGEYENEDVSSETVFSQLMKRVSSFTIEHVENITGVPAEKLTELGELLCQVNPIAYYSWNGLEQHVNSSSTNRALCILYSLTGCFDKQGGNIILPSLPVGLIKGGNLIPLSQQQKRLGLEQRPLGAPKISASGYDFADAVLNKSPYLIRGLLSFGGNMVTQNPGSENMIEALKKLEFHVHVDLFHSPMTRFADIVLPAAHAWESPSLLTGFEGDLQTAQHIQYKPPMSKPPGEARPDLQIIMDLALEMGYQEEFWDGDIEAAFNYYLGPLNVTVAQLLAQLEGISIPLNVNYCKYTENKNGGVSGFSTPTRKLEIYSEFLLERGYDPLPQFEKPITVPHYQKKSKDFPLVLSSFKLKGFCHSQHRNIARLRKMHPDPFVEIHPQTAQVYSLNEGEWVYLASPHGRMKAVARLTQSIPLGTVYTQAGWWDKCDELELAEFDPSSVEGANVNQLIGTDQLDPLSGSEPLKSYHCQIYKI
ncbi:molybdopterin-containing oxidoreductase family protein [Bacillus pumilus]|uniref:molybdopterin-containing oxidoreductase family protein n=1 Tax=Bacillus TaxID=1386 RepID=UPI0028136CCA|nr:molybdopterin-dependent oxidoreductase [Bacillus pumilus]MDR0123446.1 molybdopterin-dependent oxidoreductase [Bacillus pumilus]